MPLWRQARQIEPVRAGTCNRTFIARIGVPHDAARRIVPEHPFNPAAALTMAYFFPLNSTCLPIDLSDATGRSSVTGKFLSANTCNILVPTNPVAPTTATFISFLFGAG